MEAIASLQKTYSWFIVLTSGRAASIKNTTIQELFEATGIYPFNQDTIYNNVICLVPLEMKTKITVGLPSLAKVMQEQEELFGADIQHCTRLVLPMSDLRDKRVLHQHHSVVLTHPCIQNKKTIANMTLLRRQRARAQSIMVDHLAPRTLQLIWLLCEEQKKVEVDLFFI